MLALRVHTYEKESAEYPLVGTQKAILSPGKYLPTPAGTQVRLNRPPHLADVEVDNAFWLLTTFIASEPAALLSVADVQGTVVGHVLCSKSHVASAIPGNELPHG